MAFATAEELLLASKEGRGYYRNIGTIEAAQKYIDQKLASTLNNQQGCKADRPWQIVDMTKKLNANETWIGFEFETGFDSKADYQKFIHFLWGHNYVAIDKEGTGRYPVEVAYPPQELSDVLKNGHLLQRTLDFMEKEALKPALNPTTFTRRDVGIHAGISTKKYRSADERARYSACARLATVLDSLTKNEKEELYGRSALHWGTAHQRNGYIEIKVFRAIPESERVRKYITTTIQMTKLLDFLIDNKGVDKIANLSKFLSGETDIIKKA